VEELVERTLSGLGLVAKRTPACLSIADKSAAQVSF
jgi:hypothetical protein